MGLWEMSILSTLPLTPERDVVTVEPVPVRHYELTPKGSGEGYALAESRVLI